jgi:ATP-dependent phosphoenolpyruvate carboxykinase
VLRAVSLHVVLAEYLNMAVVTELLNVLRHTTFCNALSQRLLVVTALHMFPCDTSQGFTVDWTVYDWNCYQYQASFAGSQAL